MVFVVMLRSGKLVAVKDEWVQNIESKTTKIFFVPKDSTADFGLQAKYFFKENQTACYEAHLCKRFNSMGEAQDHIAKVERKSQLKFNHNVFRTSKARKTKNSEPQIVESYEISDSEEENVDPLAAKHPRKDDAKNDAVSQVMFAPMDVEMTNETTSQNISMLDPLEVTTLDGDELADGSMNVPPNGTSDIQCVQNIVSGMATSTSHANINSMDFETVIETTSDVSKMDHLQFSDSENSIDEEMHDKSSNAQVAQRVDTEKATSSLNTNLKSMNDESLIQSTLNASEVDPLEVTTLDGDDLADGSMNVAPNGTLDIQCVQNIVSKMADQATEMKDNHSMIQARVSYQVVSKNSATSKIVNKDSSKSGILKAYSYKKK